MVGKLRSNKVIMLFLIVGVVYLFLKYLTPVIAPVLIAMLFVTIFGSTLKKMQEKLHVNRQVGAIVLLLIAVIFLSVLVWVLFSWIVGSLPEWLSKLDALEEQLGIIVQKGCEMVGDTLGIDNAYLEDTILSSIEEGIDYFQTKAVPGVLTQSLEFVKVIIAFGGFLITFIISTVLLAKDYDRIMNNLLDREECHVLLEVICGVIRYIATFVRAQGLIIASVSTISAIVLAVAGVKHGAMWGILTGLLDALPLIGSGIVLIPLAITQLFYGFYGKAVVCILLYCGCVLLREIMEPRLIGSKMGIPAISVLIAIYAGLKLFGMWGIIKGPLGFMIIYQTYLSLQKRNEEVKEEEIAEVEE